MNSSQPIVVEVRVRADGRKYPHPMPTRAETNRLRWLEHRLRCQGGMSIRQVQRELLAQGVKRSIGAISQDITRFQCDACSDG